MSYTALYRKWRPSQFEDVKGQDPLVRTLKNQVISGRIGHAYLFCGTRGTGKTSIAKIFARAVNCEHPVDGSPCNECASCKAIAAGASFEVAEIDAASNNGVENIRDIREQVAYPPTQGKYRVYIIDEVHMLSTGAFNALLKTLEEPPSYVIFILATTEAHRIPVTVLSRCQRYDFKRIPIPTIVELLGKIAGEESLDVDEKALSYIAKLADGSLRDALSLLDQCAAFYFGQTLTYDAALSVLGAVDTQVFSEFFRALAGRDTAGCMRLVEDVVLSGRDLGQFAVDFIWYLRNILIVSATDSTDSLLDMSQENARQVRADARLVPQPRLFRYIRTFSELSNQLRTSGQKRVLFELAFIRLTSPQMDDGPEGLLERVEALERAVPSRTVQDGAVLSRTVQDGAVPSRTVPDAGSGFAATRSGAAPTGTVVHRAAPMPERNTCYGEVSPMPDAPVGVNQPAKDAVQAVKATDTADAVKLPDAVDMGRPAHEDAGEAEGRVPPEGGTGGLQLLQKEWGKIVGALGASVQRALRETTLEASGEGKMTVVFADAGMYLIGSRQSTLDEISTYVRNHYGVQAIFGARQKGGGGGAGTVSKSAVTAADLREKIHMEIEME
ncbi:MAG: DNA polymerase III subunit gamma/tau [Lachnospiraceae bacterium]|jgi:DNA polymerase-3 subunit gamma/tau|nr:DNA polymerase III subunit gamma/tau [Lachnospiraceae bacterium]